MNYPKAQQTEAFERLQGLLKPGDTVYTILRHVSTSGMMREIDVRVIKDGEPVWLSWAVSRVLGESLGKNDGVRVAGAGMDMGFHLVYGLSYHLFPDGFDCIGENCPSNDHSNREDNAHHKDGGYALRHRWL